VRVQDPPQIDSPWLRQLPRASLDVEQLRGVDLGRLIWEILQRETRIAFQNDQSIVTVHSRFEDHGRAGDPDRHRFCRNLGGAGIFSRVEQDRAAV
jgi:hypothetical protein